MPAAVRDGLVDSGRPAARARVDRSNDGPCGDHPSAQQADRIRVLSLLRRNRHLDEADVRVALRNIAQAELLERLVLLGDQTRWADERHVVLEEPVGVVGPSHHPEALCQPCRTDEESALGLSEAIIKRIAIHGRSEAKVSLDLLDG